MLVNYWQRKKSSKFWSYNYVQKSPCFILTMIESIPRNILILTFKTSNSEKCTIWKVSKCGVFSDPNTRKCGVEKTPHLDDFHSDGFQKCFEKCLTRKVCKIHWSMSDNVRWNETPHKVSKCKWSWLLTKKFSRGIFSYSQNLYL